MVSAEKTGEVFPTWQEGYLDIHHIATGRGNATFFMLPDGTTMLIDAGQISRDPGPRLVKAKPDDSRNAGEWIARYIQILLKDRQQQIDYMLVTHFHSDHIGGLISGLKESEAGNYMLTGVTEVYEHIPFDKVFDRAYPDYDWPEPLEANYIMNYRNFIDWNVKHHGLQVERFEPGRNDQMVLRNNPEAFENFEIRNIASNGKIWTGVGDNIRNHFPPLEELTPDIYPTENMLSSAIRVSYGKFDYFTGGDLVGVESSRPGLPSWHDVETPVAKAVGPVEVNVVNHHGHFDAQNEFFLATLRPKVHIIQAWSINHPAPSTLRRLLSNRIYPGPRDVFQTNIMEGTKHFIGNPINRLKSTNGHIVLRVKPGGDTFQVYILDNSDESFRIKSVHGPYKSK